MGYRETWRHFGIYSVSGSEDPLFKPRKRLKIYGIGNDASLSCHCMLQEESHTIDLLSIQIGKYEKIISQINQV